MTTRHHGNGNGVINSNECVNLNVALKNNGCANATGISATLTTSTPGVTVTQGSSSYPDMPIDAIGTNSTPFQIQTSTSFACGTEIEFDLNLTFPNGSKTIPVTVPTCTGGANQTIPPSTLTTSDLTQADRLGRDGQPSGCSGKACPGGGFPGTKFYKTYNFTNKSAAAACFTVTINAALGGAGDIESAAYVNSYDPANLCQNYLGDTGVTGTGNNGSERILLVYRTCTVRFRRSREHDRYDYLLGILWDRLRILRLHSGTWPLSGTLGLREQAHFWGESLRGSIFEPRGDRLKLKSSGICPLVSEQVSDSEQALEAAVIDAENAAELLRPADRGSAWKMA